MSQIRRLRLPLSPQQARSLRLGELVLADGEAVVTAGLPTHQRILRSLQEGSPLPIELRGGALFHMGLCSESSEGRLVPLYANPTTSTRFAAQMPAIVRGLGLTTVAGKGGLDDASAEAMAQTGCVYLSMVGGASSLLSVAVKQILETAWDDFIPQFRLTRIRFEALGPLTVAVDAHGESLYRRLNLAARQNMPAILGELAACRAKS